MGKKITNLFYTLVALFCFASAYAQEVSDPQVVLDEHFDAFTEGSTDAPVTTKDISGYSGKLRTELNWTSGRYVYEAGGSLMVGDGGNLQTSYLNLSSNGGTVRITVDIKMRDSYGGGVKVSMGYSANETKYCTDSEWHTYSFIFSGGTSSSYVKVEPVMCASGILVDNLKVETGTGFIAAPKVQQPTKATKTSFTASWIGVKGATGYLLDVYSKNGSEKEYLLKDQAVTGSYTSAYMPNTYDVTGLDESKTYFYTMRTVKDANVSEESEEIEVIPVITSVDTPVATEATDVTAVGFTANWEAVADASGYSVKVTRSSVLAEDGDVSILSEDFSGVTKGTLTGVEYPSTRESLDAYTSTKGWEGYMHCLAAGYMGISTYGSEGTITTPKLDLSANDGKFTLKLNAGANYYGTMKADECKVVVIDKAGNKAETTVSLEAAFKEYVLDLTGGDEATAIQIVYGGSNKFFIDEMSIVQTLKAGSVKKDVVDLSDVGNVTSKTYELPLDANTSYEYQVAAYVRTIVGGEPGTVYSNYSEAITVEAATPAGTLTADPKEINFWGFTPATDNYYYNTHKAIFHVEAENLTENIKYVMKSSGKTKGTTSPRITVATSGLYENRSGDLNVTCSSSKATDISDVVVISSGDVTEEVTVNVKVVNTQYNGEGIFDEEWDEYRPFTMADLNSIHTIMPKNTTFGTDPTHEFSMYFPKLRYFQGVVSAVAADADGKVTFTLADAEGDATVKVVEALYKDGQAALKAGDKVILSGDFGDVEGELQILTASIEEITADAPADDTVYGTFAAPVALEDGKTYGMNADKTGGLFNYYTFESAEDVKITLTTTPGTNPGGGFGVMTGNFMFDDQYNDLEGYVMLGEDDLTTEMVPVGGEEGGVGGDDDFGVGFGSFVISTSWNAKAGEKYYIMCQGAGTFTVALSEAETGEKVGTMTNPINLNETPTWTWGVDGKVPGSATYYTYKAEKAGELTITNGNEEIFVGEDGWYDGFVNTGGPAYTGEIKKETNWADYTAAYTFAVEEGVTYCITIFDLTKGNEGEVIKAEFVEGSDEPADNVEWDPAPGEIDYNSFGGKLDQFILTFTDADMVELNEIPFKANIEDENGNEVDFMYGVNFYFLGWNQACITMNKGVTADGTYTVNVPAGLFTLTMPDGTTKASSELHATYIVTGAGEGPAPGGKMQILPAEGNVTSLQQFTLVINDWDSQFDSYNSKAQFYKDGELVEEVEFDYNPDDWSDPNLYGSLSAPVTEEGTYTLEFPVGSMTTDSWATSNTEPVVYTWTIGEGGGEEELPYGTYAAPIALEEGKTYGLNAAETGAPNFYTFESDEDVKIILTPTEGSIVEGGFGVSTGNFLMDEEFNDLEDAVYFEDVEVVPVGGNDPGIGGDDDFFDDFGFGFGRMSYSWTAKAGVKYYIMAMGQGAFTVELAEVEDEGEKVGTIENPINLNETAEWTWGVDGKRPGSATHYTFTAEKDGKLAISTSADTELSIGVDGWWDPYFQTEGPKYDGEIETSNYDLNTYTATYTFAVEAGVTYCITIYDLAGDVVKAEFIPAEDPDAINGAAADKANGAIFNVQGQKVDKTAKGIVIINGRKVLKK